jgi:HEPN domain-containing protein
MRQWFTYAARDLKAAKLMAAQGPQLKRQTAFHVQQCIEKALKGFLVFHNQRPPHGHKLEVIGKLVFPFDPGLKPLLQGARRISRYTIDYRYPDGRKRQVPFRRVVADVKLAEEIFDRLLNAVS